MLKDADPAYFADIYIVCGYTDYPRSIIIREDCYHYKDQITQTGSNSAVQKRNTTVLLRKSVRLASQYASN